MTNTVNPQLESPASVSFEQLLDLEREDINLRRAQLGRPALPAVFDPAKVRIVGLALSGGGIRSAALSLGAIEALSTAVIPGRSAGPVSANAVFSQIDYLSGVSGGSYAACSISAKVFHDRTELPLSPSHDPGATSYLSFVRTHSKILDDYFEIMTNWMYGFLVGLLTVLPFLLVVAAIQISLIRDDHGLQSAIELFSDRWRYALATGGLVYLLFAVVSSSQITDRRAVEWSWKLFLFLLLAAGFVGLQPVLIQTNLPNGQLHDMLRSISVFDVMLRTEAQEVLMPAVLLLVLAAVLIALLMRREQFLRDTISSPRALVYGIAVQLCLAAIFVCAPVLIWSMVLTLTRWGIAYRSCGVTIANHCAPEWIVLSVGKLNEWLAPLYHCLGVEAKFRPYAKVIPGLSFSMFYGLVAVVLFIIMKYVIDSNSSSFHRFYSDRLRSCFFVRLGSGAGQGQQVPAISRLYGTIGPYLLVNCALNASGSKGNLSKAVDEPFVIASRYTGNEAVGYIRTDLLERATGPSFDLASIAAVSGAAFAPVMGRYTIPSFRLLMSMLALRLGYWIPNPQRTGEFGPAKKGASPVGRRVDGLYFLREMFGWLSVNTRFLYITDGGHSDNSGIYELLRRRCSTIIAVDAEPDSEELFENIAYLIEFARARLNLEIELTCKTVGAAGGTHCAIGRIRYPSRGNSPASEGRLVFIKLSLTGDENWDLLCRRKASGEFPYHSTMNQNYDELLFNAYRTLGIHMVSRVFNGTDRVEFWNGNVKALAADEIAALF